jgi:outer membrane protein
MKKLSLLFVVSLSLAAAWPFAVQAEQRPLWEFGMGVAGISFPDYRGADERTGYVLPMPYIVYRGEFLQADQKRGIRALFLKQGPIELDMSYSGTPPVKSNHNAARTGMPDLDATLEVGPSLNITAFESADKRQKLELRMPVRAVIASDFHHIRGQGWVFQPQLNLDTNDVFGATGWNLGVATGPLFGDRRYHNYIYGVEAPYATAVRPAYQGRGGYAGTQVITALSKRYSNFWVGGFMKYDNLNGAAFDDSPLTKSKHGFAAGIGIAWIFSESKTKVEVTK